MWDMKPPSTIKWGNTLFVSTLDLSSRKLSRQNTGYIMLNRQVFMMQPTQCRSPKTVREDY